MAIVFDGNQYAQEWRRRLVVPAGVKIAAIVFTEDEGGQLYTRKKAAAATELGIEYQPYFFSLEDELSEVLGKIEELNQDQRVTGIIVQKPQRRVYQDFWQGREELNFPDWWRTVMSAVQPEKDVDGLTSSTLVEIEAGTWQQEGRVLPATVQAVLQILVEAEEKLGWEKPVFGELGKRMIIVGKSDLLGIPLAAEARRLGYEVELWGRREIQEKRQTGEACHGAPIIITATGVPGLITGDMVDSGTVLIDAGEPQGDLDWDSCWPKAAFITPVPGGVGPLTVTALMANAIELAA